MDQVILSFSLRHSLQFGVLLWFLQVYKLCLIQCSLYLEFSSVRLDLQVVFNSVRLVFSYCGFRGLQVVFNSVYKGHLSVLQLFAQKRQG